MSRAGYVLFLLLTGLLACSPHAATLYEERTPSQLQEAYRDAIADAQRAEGDDIYRDLVAITAHDDRITWQGEPGASAILVATWTDESFAPHYESGDYLTNEETWITIAPELEEFCSSLDLPEEALAIRLAQLLGLPPHPGYDRIAEFWVDPADLFRPCPDPEITDSQCELDFPQPDDLVQIDSSHIAWIEKNTEAFYSENGYPWTRLGYTYDWGNPNSNIGLSEFVVRPESAIQLERVTSTQSYCN